MQYAFAILNGYKYMRFEIHQSMYIYSEFTFISEIIYPIYRSSIKNILIGKQCENRVHSVTISTEYRFSAIFSVYNTIATLLQIPVD